MRVELTLSGLQPLPSPGYRLSSSVLVSTPRSHPDCVHHPSYGTSHVAPGDQPHISSVFQAELTEGKCTLGGGLYPIVEDEVFEYQEWAHKESNLDSLVISQAFRTTRPYARLGSQTSRFGNFDFAKPRTYLGRGFSAVSDGCGGRI